MSPRDRALDLDAADPLAALRDRFVVSDPGLIYLDGNSLGRLPKATVERIGDVVGREWGADLIGSWAHWVELPRRAGDLIGASLIGASAGQVVVSDSTTVNLYKLACAALDARPDRRVIVLDDDNFPTDRYVFEGLAAQRGCSLRWVKADMDTGVSLEALRAAVDSDVALVGLSHVAYRSGALLDMRSVNEIAHDEGALVLWDLCHSAGAVPVDLDGCGSDLAVGCTYKYLNGGPGSPAFLYVRRDLQERLRQPIWGWFGQRDQFQMGPSYDPLPSVDRFLAGTPAILGLAAVEEGVRVLAAAGIEALRAKGIALTEYMIELASSWLPSLRLASPHSPSARGSHVSFHHPDAWRFCQALIRDRVIPDYRTPDRLRLGPSPITTRFVDVWDGMDRLRRIVESRSYEQFSPALSRVT